jgi:biopolymer transport protein ExbD
MKLKRRNSKGHAAVEASSLSDILFFLMLFFLMISTMASPSAIKLLLPNSKSGQTIPKETINLYIDANSNFSIETEKVTLEEITVRLTAKANAKEKPTIVIRADKSIPLENLIKILDIVNGLKLPSVVATIKPS